jgi:hypothetical protein
MRALLSNAQRQAPGERGALASPTGLAVGAVPTREHYVWSPPKALSLDGFEHDGTRVGMTKSERKSGMVCKYPITALRLRAGAEVPLAHAIDSEWTEKRRRR